MEDRIRDYFAGHLEVGQQLLDRASGDIAHAAKVMIEVLENNRKIMLCGNGGSAADAQHIAAELTGRFFLDRKPLPAIALTTDTSALTAIGNDFGFEQIFARQLEGLGKKGDLLIGISTSGNSPNIIEAIRAAQEMGIRTLGLSGGRGGRLGELVARTIVIPTDYTPQIQEFHITVGHILCDLIDVHFAK